MSFSVNLKSSIDNRRKQGENDGSSEQGDGEKKRQVRVDNLCSTTDGTRMDYNVKNNMYYTVILAWRSYGTFSSLLYSAMRFYSGFRHVCYIVTGPHRMIPVDEIKKKENKQV